MGDQEKISRQKARRGQVRHIILSSVAVAGLLTVAAIAPNALRALNKLGLMSTRGRKQFVNKSRDKLIKNGFLVYKGKYVTLTEKGRRALSIAERKHFQMRKPKRWDKKWRILVFDIPEYRKSDRDKVRHTLIEIGFYRLQDSVWVYPYDCEDLITLLKADFKIGKDLLYIIAESIEYDKPLREHFGFHHS